MPCTRKRQYSKVVVQGEDTPTDYIHGEVDKNAVADRYIWRRRRVRPDICHMLSQDRMGFLGFESLAIIVDVDDIGSSSNIDFSGVSNCSGVDDLEGVATSGLVAAGLEDVAAAGLEAAPVTRRDMVEDVPESRRDIGRSCCFAMYLFEEAAIYLFGGICEEEELPYT